MHLGIPLSTDRYRDDGEPESKRKRGTMTATIV